MFLPLLLLILAVLASAFLAYGIHPTWAQYPGGVSLIVWSRHLQWPLAAAAILLCLAVVGLVVTNKRRAWWLIGLAPVLAFFYHRFHGDPLLAFTIADNPSLRQPAEVTFLSDNDYVIGLVHQGAAYAYPAYALYKSPIVVQSDHDQRFIVMWSPFANRATAHLVDRDFHARDLEIASMPVNATLIYNRKYGQFINGITGQTHDRKTPTGFGRPITSITKTSWARWKQLHPTTRVMTPLNLGAPKIPNAALEPWFPKPALNDQIHPELRITLIAATQPVALQSDSIKEAPQNIAAGDTPILVFRDPATGRARAFNRAIDDLRPTFSRKTDPKRKEAYFVDSDTNTLWTIDGRPLTGPLAEAKKRLAPIPVDENLYWATMKFWMPNLELK